jgi:glycosyltransferase involved in cell wall biosynthesis
MKILVLALPMGEAGGIQVYTATLVRALRKISGDSAVRLLAVPDPPASSSAHAPGLSSAAKARFFLRALLQAMRWRPDLCICTHVALAPLGHVIHVILRCPFWVSAHGIEVWGRLSRSRHRALSAADRVLAVSAFTRDRVVARHQLSPLRTNVLANVLDGDLLSLAPDARKLESLHLVDRRPILTVGRISAAERYKGHDVLLHALPAILERVPRALYLVAGGGDDRARLESLARKMGVADSVSFLGRMNRAELAACYRACEVFALPARTVLDDDAPKGEGFGIAYLEAMAFGRPVIGPRAGAPAEFIRHGETGLLVDPDDPAEVAAACISLLIQPELARAMGERGRRLVEQEYSFDALVQRLEALLHSSQESIKA